MAQQAIEKWSLEHPVCLASQPACHGNHRKTDSLSKNIKGGERVYFISVMEEDHLHKRLTHQQTQILYLT